MPIDILTAKQVAELLGCAPSTVNERARSGDLPGLQFGDGGWIFPAGALAARLDELASEQAAKRRKAPAPGGVLCEIKQGRRGAVRRALPVLP